MKFNTMGGHGHLCPPPKTSNFISRNMREVDVHLQANMRDLARQEEAPVSF